MEKVVDGELIEMTAEEVAERQAEELKWRDPEVPKPRDLLAELDELKERILQLEAKR